MLRFAKPEDAEELLKIYAPYVNKTAISFEYEVPSVAEFEERIKAILKKYPYIVEETNGELVGYAYADTFKARSAYAWAVESTVYVKADLRKCGIGSRLYGTLERLLRMQNIINVNACIAYTDKPDKYLTNDSIYFHERMGYKTVGKFHKCGYKFGKWYDMIWMEKHLGEHMLLPEPIKSITEIRQIVDDIK